VGLAESSSEGAILAVGDALASGPTGEGAGVATGDGLTNGCTDSGVALGSIVGTGEDRRWRRERRYRDAGLFEPLGDGTTKVCVGEGVSGATGDGLTNDSIPVGEAVGSAVGVTKDSFGPRVNVDWFGVAIGVGETGAFAVGNGVVCRAGAAAEASGLDRGFSVLSQFRLTKSIETRITKRLPTTAPNIATQAGNFLL
jgi:hypothetical protein